MFNFETSLFWTWYNEEIKKIVNDRFKNKKNISPLTIENFLREELKNHLDYGLEEFKNIQNGFIYDLVHNCLLELDMQEIAEKLFGDLNEG